MYRLVRSCQLGDCCRTSGGKGGGVTASPATNYSTTVVGAVLLGPMHARGYGKRNVWTIVNKNWNVHWPNAISRWTFSWFSTLMHLHCFCSSRSSTTDCWEPWSTISWPVWPHQAYQETSHERIFSPWAKRVACQQEELTTSATTTSATALLPSEFEACEVLLILADWWKNQLFSLNGGTEQMKIIELVFCMN